MGATPPLVGVAVKVTEVPEQIDVAVAVIETDGTKVGFTVTVLLAVAVPQEPTLVVNVRVAVPEYPAGGVHVAFRIVAEGLKVPPAGVDQVPPVAPPPTEPPSPAVVPLWQIAAITGPALTVGFGFTVIVLLADVVPHSPPDVVRVRVTVAGAVADAV